MCIDDNNSGRPSTPLPEDCCKNDCNPCVFEIHKELLERWEKRKNSKNTEEKKNILSLTAYKILTVSNLSKINDSYVEITLALKQNEENNGEIILQPGQHVVVSYFSHSRPLTPVSWEGKSLRLLVRLYEDSVFTNKMKNLQIGEEIKVRGPYGNFKYKRNSFSWLFMFGIGSGLAALYPVAKSIIDDELEETRIHLIAGFPSVDQVPLKHELKLLTDYWNFQCTLYLTNWTDNPMERINGIQLESGKIDCDIVKEILKNKSIKESLVLICGNGIFNETLETLMKELEFNYYIFK